MSHTSHASNNFCHLLVDSLQSVYILLQAWDTHTILGEALPALNRAEECFSLDLYVALLLMQRSLLLANVSVYGLLQTWLDSSPWTKCGLQSHLIWPSGISVGQEVLMAGK